MKTIFQFCLFAIISIATVSCEKSGLLPNPDSINDVPLAIDGKINRSIMEPTYMTLGTSAAIMHEGDQVTILLPYDVTNRNIVNSNLTLIDDASGTPIAAVSLVPSTDPSASLVSLPANMYNSQGFFFATFVIDATFVGKTVSLSATVEEDNSTNTDVLNAAFSVE